MPISKLSDGGGGGDRAITLLEVWHAHATEVLHSATVDVEEQRIYREVSPHCILLSCPCLYLWDAGLYRDVIDRGKISVVIGEEVSQCITCVSLSSEVNKVDFNSQYFHIYCL